MPLAAMPDRNTAGAISEGGYLGLAELQYVHTPPPEKAWSPSLSDGAFEEQRGSDWAPRWWRAEDCGFAIPVMVLNGRRIEQRTQIVQEGENAGWLAEDLRHNGFDPIIVDGRDPAAIAWAIIEAEDALSAFVAQADWRYPAKLPYVIAETEKGFGFPALLPMPLHNLPLAGNPRENAQVRAVFTASAGAFCAGGPAEGLSPRSRTTIGSGACARADTPWPTAVQRTLALPLPNWAPAGASSCAMAALDHWFVALVQSESTAACASAA